MFESDDNNFPNKPELALADSKPNWGKTVSTMLLFIAAFFFFFSQNYLLILLITGILLIHELGHFVMMKKYGYKSVNMLFIPIFGALVSGDKFKISQNQKYWISMMGPLPGLLIGSIGFIYCIEVEQFNLLFEASLLLILINSLNLLPLDPLDGGHVVETLFFPNSSSFRLYFTLISSLLLISIGVYFQVYLIVIFGFLMSFKVRGIQKSQRIHDNLDEINVNYKKSYHELSDREYWTIRRIFLENNPKIKEIIPDDLVLWENEKLLVDQVRQLLRADVQVDLNIMKRLVYFVLFMITLLGPLALLYINVDAILTTYDLAQ
ncbi:site-2 protease family protein [Paracrocinitomix mangrovi]|uniref:site-2 protease family protein n=1 Tax=Paracrocinitomix mangrovi TaxID=2862509 RepID=UPI00300D4C91